MSFQIMVYLRPFSKDELDAYPFLPTAHQGWELIGHHASTKEPFDAAYFRPNGMHAYLPDNAEKSIRCIHCNAKYRRDGSPECPIDAPSEGDDALPIE